MGYLTNGVFIIFLLIVNVLQALAITTRFDHDIPPSRNFRRHIDTFPVPNWELGLREAVYQALLRERNLLPHLREYLHSAPIIGRQDTATPFGDIAIVARGQLYSAPGGFQFVQDPYQNDCDGCHNARPRCDRASCENWKPQGHERLLALWTIKRIRHRDSNYGYRYELEYKITPMNVAASEHFVTRNGRFDYSVPGHTFIVKADPRQQESTFEKINSISDKVHRTPHSFHTNHWSPNNYKPNFDAHYLPPPPPVSPIEEGYYDNDPRKVGYPNVVYGPPELYTRPPYIQFTTTRKYQHHYDSEEDERDPFNNFFDPFSSTTTTTQKTTSSTSTSTQSSDFDIFANTQTSPPIFTPVATTKSSPETTPPTITEHLSKTTQRDTSHYLTSIRVPILPTIPIYAPSEQTTETFKNTPSIMHSENIPSTKPLFSSPTIRFPTISSHKSTLPFLQDDITRTTPTTRYSEKVNFVKYSEPDSLHSSSHSFPSTESIQLFPTRTTVQYKPPTTTKLKTTEGDDYDIFGDGKMNEMTSEKPKNIKFPGAVNVKVPPGEQVITVVEAPTMIPKSEQEQKDMLPITESTQTIKITPKYQVDFNNTQLLYHGDKSYVTISLNPSTRNQQSSFGTESATRNDATTKHMLPTMSPIQGSPEDHIDLTTRRYNPVTKNHAVSHRVTTTPLIRTTSRSIKYSPRTKFFTRMPLFKTTTPLTTASFTTDSITNDIFSSSTLLSINTVSTSRTYLPKPRTTLPPTTTPPNGVTLPPKRKTSLSFSPSTRKVYSTLKPPILKPKPTQSKPKSEISPPTVSNEETTRVLLPSSRHYTTSVKTYAPAYTTSSVDFTDSKITKPPTTIQILETKYPKTFMQTIETTNPSTFVYGPESTRYQNSIFTNEDVFSSNVPSEPPMLSTNPVPLRNRTDSVFSIFTTYTTPTTISSYPTATTSEKTSTIVPTKSKFYTMDVTTTKINHLPMTQTTSSMKPIIDDFLQKTTKISSRKPTAVLTPTIVTSEPEIHTIGVIIPKDKHLLTTQTTKTIFPLTSSVKPIIDDDFLQEPTAVLQPTIVTSDPEIHTIGIITPKDKHMSTAQATSSIRPIINDDFLQDTIKVSSKKPIVVNDNNDDDIFGKPQNKVFKLTTPKMQNKENFNSKEIDDIFGESEIAELSSNKKIYNEISTEPSTLTTSTLRIIFSNFFSPSTALTTEKSFVTENPSNEKEDNIEKTTINEPDDLFGSIDSKTTESESITSKSYSTSVSLEINNKTTVNNEFIDTLGLEILTDLPEKVEHKLPTQIPCTNVTENNIKGDNKILNDLTLSVVNHAKSINILSSNDSNTDDNSHVYSSNNDKDNNNNNIKERKYKRKRTYKVQKLNRHT